MGTAAADTAAEPKVQVANELRKYKPHKVRAILPDGTQRDVAVPAGRKCWSKVADILDSFAWVKVECLDRTGALLGFIETDVEPEAGGAAKQELPKEYALLDLMLRAQSEGNKSLALALDKVTGSLVGIVGILDSRVDRLERMHERNLRRLEDAVDGDDDDSGKAGMREAMADLMMAWAKERMKPAPASNGANGAAKADKQ